MKKSKKVFLILCIAVMAVAIAVDIIALIMRGNVSGDNLFELSTETGYFYATNYQWVSLVALGLSVVSVSLIIIWLIAWRKEKHRKAQ